eukprot:3120897-Rhodomonas_salina.1
MLSETARNPAVGDASSVGSSEFLIRSITTCGSDARARIHAAIPRKSCKTAARNARSEPASRSMSETGRACESVRRGVGDLEDDALAAHVEQPVHLAVVLLQHLVDRLRKRNEAQSSTTVIQGPQSGGAVQKTSGARG